MSFLLCELNRYDFVFVMNEFLMIQKYSVSLTFDYKRFINGFIYYDFQKHYCNPDHCHIYLHLAHCNQQIY